MRLNKTSIIILLLLGLLHFNSDAQILNNVTKPSLTKYSLAEKIYLQLDNTLYQTGDNIWFKAVVTKSYDNSLSDISEILYIELIDANETIIEKKTLKLKEGLVSGSFALEESYTSGKYFIRAYTNWNRNFEDHFMFTQPIDVFNIKENIKPKNPISNIVIGIDSIKTLTADINPKVINSNYRGKLKLYLDFGTVKDSIDIKRDKDNLYRLSYKLPENVTQAKLKFSTKVAEASFLENITKDFSKTIVIDEDYLDVQFFPEGGQLVNGLISTVGFKSINYKGLGYKISGSIKDGKGNIITAFNSNDLGLGTFKLLPENGRYYYAELRVNEVAYKYNLPLAINTGRVLSVAKLKDEIRILLVSKGEEDSNITIKTESRGVNYHHLKFKNKDTITALIPSETLPEGVIKISVLNDKKQIICHRFIFNDKPNHRLALEAKIDNEIYTQREKTTLKILLHDIEALENTSLSVLVLDKEKADASKLYKSNLLSSLLLSSELKGFIENPSHYFDEENREKLLDLDALMLTQGWRNYKYKNTEQTTTYRFKPEKNLIVSGTIGQYFNPLKRPKKPLDLNMIVYGEPQSIYKQEIDSSGNYYFQLNDIFKPKAEFFMQVVNKKGKPIDFDINRDKKWQPKINIKPQQTVQLPNAIVTTFTENVKAKNKIRRDYEVAYNTVALDEVKLRDYKLTPAREAFIGIHGEPDAVIEGKEINKKAPDWQFGLFSVLRSKFKEDIKIINEGPVHDQFLRAVVRGYDKPKSFTYVLVDNIEVEIDDYRLIGGLPIEEVESIDIIKDPKDKNRYCHILRGPYCPERVALINIYTYSKKGIFGISKAEGVLTDYVQGFSESVTFYAPSYETLTNQDWAMPDNRSVIHWSPELKLDENGEYILEYYNDDHIGEVSVIIEAISKDGKLGYIEKAYTIKEAER